MVFFFTCVDERYSVYMGKDKCAHFTDDMNRLFAMTRTKTSVINSGLILAYSSTCFTFRSHSLVSLSDAQMIGTFTDKVLRTGRAMLVWGLRALSCAKGSEQILTFRVIQSLVQ